MQPRFPRSTAARRLHVATARALRSSVRTRTRTALAVEPLEVRRMLSTYTVNTVTDLIDPNDGKMSLREAIIAANVSSGEDTIKLAAEKYFLKIEGAGEDNSNTGDLDVRYDLKIQGASSNGKQSTIDASMLVARDRVMQLFNSKVCIDNVTISGGTQDFGGGIHATGKSLTITKSNFCNNNASGLLAAGGAIATLGTSLDICDTKFTNNCASGLLAGGGAIGTALSDKVKLTRCTFDTNTASGLVAVGGAVAAAIIGTNSLDIEQMLAGDSATISRMRARSGNNGSACGGVTFDGCTFKCNTADAGVAAGGGAFLLLTNATIKGTKFERNIATGDSGLGAAGGGVAALLTRMTIDNSCFTCNSAIGEGEESLALGGGLAFVLGLNNLTAPTLTSGSQTCSVLDLNVTNTQFTGNTAKLLLGPVGTAGKGVAPENIELANIAAGGGAFVAAAWAKFSCNTQFCDNSAKGFLAGVGGGMATLLVSLEVSDSSFKNNCASGLIAAGGGLATALSDRVKLKNDLFERNSANGLISVGGGFAAAVVGFNAVQMESLVAGDSTAASEMRARSGNNNNACAAITIDCVTFKRNTASGAAAAGGGAFLLLTNTSIKASKFDSNSATGDSELGAFGGGLCTILSKLSIDGTCFNCNSATGTGDGSLALGGGLAFLLGLSALTTTTLVNGTPTSNYLDLNVTNTQFTGNTARVCAGNLPEAGHARSSEGEDLGGIAAGGGAFVGAAYAKFSCNVQFCNNSAKGLLAGLGGGMATLCVSLEVTDSKFKDNCATGLIAAGGGLATALSDRTKLKNDWFECNSANGLIGVGGGFAAAVVGVDQRTLESLVSDDPTVAADHRSRGGTNGSNCGVLSMDCVTFKNNTARGAFAAGGGAFLLLVNGNVKNSKFELNKADGAVLGAGGGLKGILSKLNIDCTTFNCNSATASEADADAYGGGLAFAFGLSSMAPDSATPVTSYDLSITGSSFTSNTVKGGTGIYQNPSAQDGALKVGGDAFGGGAYVGYASTYITTSKFTSNIAQGGEGSGSLPTPPPLTIGETYAGEAIGGGLALDYVYAKVTCSDFCKNEARGGNAIDGVMTPPPNGLVTPAIPPEAGRGAGGGIGIIGRSLATLDRLNVKENKALGGKFKNGANWIYAGPAEGGGIYVDLDGFTFGSPEVVPADVKILNSCIECNIANGLRGRGGGVYIGRGNVFIDNPAKVKNNDASHEGDNIFQEV